MISKGQLPYFDEFITTSINTSHTSSQTLPTYLFYPFQKKKQVFITI